MFAALVLLSSVASVGVVWIMDSSGEISIEEVAVEPAPKSDCADLLCTIENGGVTP